MKHLSVKSSYSPLSLQGRAGVGLLFLLSFFFLFSCTEDDTQERSSGAVGEVISRQLRISAMPMLNTFSATTNRSIENEAAMDAIYGAQTRATGVEPSDSEKELKSVHVLQFSGTEDASVLMKVGDDIASALNDNNGTIDYEFEDNGKMQRVYIVANMDIKDLVENRTTLKQFEESVRAFTCTTTVPASGLPMCGYQEFNPSTDYPASFTLKILVSKLTFQYSLPADLKTEKAMLRNIPNGYTVKQAVAGAEASQPIGINYNATFNLSAANEKQVHYYLPANLAGQDATVTKEIDRSQRNAPSDATFVEIVTSKDDDMWAYYLALGNGKTEDFNVAGGHSYTITALIRGTNKLDKRVVKFINLSLTKEGTPATANCYVISANGGKYFFDSTRRGNGASTPAVVKDDNNKDAAPAIDGTGKMGTKSARILWETGKVVNNAIKHVDMTDDGRIFFESPSGTVGNTIIAAYSGANTTGSILWSWHIWKPEALEELDAVKWNHRTDGDVLFKMLDRNLGATTSTPGLTSSNGLAYQWGRKDPFPGGKMTAADIIPNGIIKDMRNTTGVTVDYAIQNPTTYTGTISIAGFFDNDWKTTDGRLNNLWGTPVGNEITIATQKFNGEKGSKSIYDPCPIGYRVPPGDVMSKYYQQNGTTNKPRPANVAIVLDALSPDIYFPLAGYSGEYSGPYQLTLLGAYGVYWLSTPIKGGQYQYAQALELQKASLNVRSNGSAARSCSASVRCVSEEVTE